MVVLKACSPDSWTSNKTVLGWVTETNAPAWRAQTTHVRSLPVPEAGSEVCSGLPPPEAGFLGVEILPSPCVLEWLSLCVPVS